MAVSITLALRNKDLVKVNGNSILSSPSYVDSELNSYFRKRPCLLLTEMVPAGRHPLLRGANNGIPAARRHGER